MKSKALINTVLFFILSMTIGTIVPYYLHFKDHAFATSSPTDWGVFGDFFGGVLGTLIGILNLIVLVRLTYYVADQDKRTALNQFRFEFYQKLKDAFDQFDANKSSGRRQKMLSVALDSAKDYIFLFPEISKDYTLKITGVKSAIDELRSGGGIRSVNFEDANDPFTVPISAHDVVRFEKAKQELIILLQSAMITDSLVTKSKKGSKA